ncbi:MAG: hypothetical protein KA187_09205 [Arenimonas sp.]|nr:hypothetical protein [Arenimonas sp.]
MVEKQSPARREPPIALAGRSRSALVWPIAVEWPLLKVQRSVASRDDELQVPAPAVIGPQNLTGCSQSFAEVGSANSNDRFGH